MDFHITYHFNKRAIAYAFNEEYLEGYDPLWIALFRFNASCEGEFIVPLEGNVLIFMLEDDFPMVFDELPEWLTHLANEEGESTLLFASQGTELKLVAVRQDNAITLSAKSISPNRPLPPSMRPITVSVSQFLQEWGNFILAILDTLLIVDTDLARSPEYKQYRAAITDAIACGLD